MNCDDPDGAELAMTVCEVSTLTSALTLGSENSSAAAHRVTYDHDEQSSQ